MSKAQDRAEAADLLDRAALTIEERGHWKGFMEGPGGQVCALGALNVCRQPFGDRVWLEARAALRLFLCVPIGMWNDWPEVSSERVCREMRECAADLRA